MLHVEEINVDNYGAKPSTSTDQVTTIIDLVDQHSIVATDSETTTSVEPATKKRKLVHSQPTFDLKSIVLEHPLGPLFIKPRSFYIDEMEDDKKVYGSTVLTKKKMLWTDNTCSGSFEALFRVTERFSNYSRLH